MLSLVLIASRIPIIQADPLWRVFDFHKIDGGESGCQAFIGVWRVILLPNEKANPSMGLANWF